MQVQVRYGCELFSKVYPEGTTFGDICRDHTVKAALGCGDNVKATMSGVEMPADVLVPGNALVTLETKANTKALALAA